MTNWTSRIKPSTSWSNNRDFVDSFINDLDLTIDEYNLMTINGTMWIGRKIPFFTDGEMAFLPGSDLFFVDAVNSVLQTNWTNRA